MQMPTECPIRGSLNKRGLNFHKTKGVDVNMVVGVGSVIQNIIADITVILLVFFLMVTNAIQCIQVQGRKKRKAGKGFLPLMLCHFVQKGKFLPGRIPLVSH